MITPNNVGTLYFELFFLAIWTTGCVVSSLIIKDTLHDYEALKENGVPIEDSRWVLMRIDCTEGVAVFIPFLVLATNTLWVLAELIGWLPLEDKPNYIRPVMVAISMIILMLSRVITYRDRQGLIRREADREKGEQEQHG